MTGSAPDTGQIGNGRALYSISVASELSGVDPQMLRVYEQRGLLSPFRTDGGTRRYSEKDLERVATITALLGEGLNLAGIGHVLELRAQTSQLADELGEFKTTAGPDREEVLRLQQENQDLRAEVARLEEAHDATTQVRETKARRPRTPGKAGEDSGSPRGRS